MYLLIRLVAQLHTLNRSRGRKVRIIRRGNANLRPLATQMGIQLRAIQRDSHTKLYHHLEKMMKGQCVNYYKYLP